MCATQITDHLIKCWSLNFADAPRHQFPKDYQTIKYAFYVMSINHCSYQHLSGSQTSFLRFSESSIADIWGVTIVSQGLRIILRQWHMGSFKEEDEQLVVLIMALLNNISGLLGH